MTECKSKSHRKSTPRRRRRADRRPPIPCDDANATYLDFPVLGSRQVIAAFDGGDISSDGGSLLLRKAEGLTAIIQQFAACFTDYRDPELIEHPLEDLIAQRIYGLALGYEDLNDHDDLRHDPLLATVVGKTDPTGQSRRRKRDKGKALAGKSTLNRLELTPVGADEDSRYKKIACNTRAVDDVFVELFLQAYSVPPDRIVLDVDATDDPIHGHQLGRFFNGYYKHYCFLPLYIFCGDHLLCARLRPSDIDASAGALKQLQRIVARIRQVWPQVKMIVEQSEQARVGYETTKQPTRVFAELRYETRDSWSRERRVVAKAEHLEKGANPRFVVTSLDLEQHPAKDLYEDDYCGRGEMENRIKEQQLHLFADRTSTKTMRANQIRLFFSSIAYTLLEALRRLGLAGTSMAQAQCQTIRLRLLKIGALVQVTVRKVWVRLASSCPSADIFREAFANLDKLRPVVLRC